VTAYLIFNVRGVQGRYFVIALPMAAIFIASMANSDLPRDVFAATAITGSFAFGASARSAGAISSPAKSLGLEVPMRRQDGRSVSKLTNQTSFGATETPPTPAQSLPRNVAGRYCLCRSPPAWRIVEDQ
jgi:hypothetical protein